ncbi:IclR family transcriptional regulator [Paenibacillus filicis]|uniref:IclR family transcriptional regulator n=1 Tax=Paenibacillus filicis TaxID=669464 RepID=A0ABU9DFM4_9BACL
MSGAKMLDILDLFSLEHWELSVPQIAVILEQPQSTVYRHLRVLKEKGYVMEAQAGVYKLGYRFLEKARMIRSQNSLASVALPAMRVLTKETEETAILTIASDLVVICLERVESTMPIKVSAEIGQVLPLHAGASSKPLLAYMPEETVDLLHSRELLRKFADNTIVDTELLKADLRRIRERGYAVSESEVDEQVLAYGAPIRDADGQVIAVLSIAGPVERLSQKAEAQLVSHLHQAVHEIQTYL